jgi:hypothetical protein
MSPINYNISKESVRLELTRTDFPSIAQRCLEKGNLWGEVNQQTAAKISVMRSLSCLSKSRCNSSEYAPFI